MSPSMHRTRAREALRGNWPTAIWITLVASWFGGLSFTIPQFQLLVQQKNMMFRLNSGIVVSVGIFGLIALILGGALHVGYCRYQLNLLDGREARFSDLASFMDHFGSALCMHVIRSLAITLGTICLIVPGILFTYGFSMAGYIMAEDPDCGAVEALKRSWALMSGRKMDLFVLGLTFIGWALLAVLTLGIGLLFLQPYIEAAYTSFYRELRSASRHPN